MNGADAGPPGDTELLRALWTALAQLDVSARLDTTSPALPLLWIPIPQTHTAREMVLVAHDKHGPLYQWDERTWADAATLASALAAYVESHPNWHSPRRWPG